MLEKAKYYEIYVVIYIILPYLVKEVNNIMRITAIKFLTFWQKIIFGRESDIPEFTDRSLHRITVLFNFFLQGNITAYLGT